jgi:hypothetical protein
VATESCGTLSGKIPNDLGSQLWRV